MSSFDAAVSPTNTAKTAVPRLRRTNLGQSFGGIGIHAVLLSYTVLAMFPIILTVLNWHFARAYLRLRGAEFAAGDIYLESVSAGSPNRLKRRRPHRRCK